MKRFERIAVVLIFLWLIQWVFASITPFMIYQFVGDNDYSPEMIQTYTSSLTAISVVIQSLTRIVCGVWLFQQAKKEHQSKWVWCAVGLFFSVSAIILFVTYLILGELRKPKSEPVV